jgi:hypothetical protein
MKLHCSFAGNLYRGIFSFCFCRASSFVELSTNLWSCQTSPSYSLAAVALVLTHRSLLSSGHADEILRTSLQSILSSSVKQPPLEVLESLIPFLGTITQSQWDECYSPSLCRLIKKSPENSAPIVTLICCHIQVDFSQFLESTFAATAIKMLKSNQSNTRESTLKAITSIVKKCSAIGSVCTLLTALVDALVGKVPGSALTQEFQKAAMLAAISQCSLVFHRFNRSEVQGLASLAIDQCILSLLLCVDKEPDEQIKYDPSQ